MIFLKSHIVFVLFSSLRSPETDSLQAPDLGSIFEPQDILFSFNTPAWHVLFALLCLFVILLMVSKLKRYRENAYRRKAWLDMEAIAKKPQTETSLKEIFVLLKKTAIITFGREEVAPLYGSKWLRYLEEKGKNTPFTTYEDYILASNYQLSERNINKNKAIVALSKKWILTHA